MRPLVLSVLAAAVLLVAKDVQAAAVDSPTGFNVAGKGHDPWQVSWLSPDDDPVPVSPTSSSNPFESLMAFSQGDAGTQPTHASAVEYSDAYQLRRKVHKYASFATLPLFGIELALGQSLYNPTATTSGTTTRLDNGGGKRTAHAVVGASIVGLFGVNTVTGAWNLFGEGWSDTNGRTRRLVHGLLMMAADVGFVAASASGPNSGGRNGALTFATDEATHRKIAVTSISVATAGYLLMLFGN